MQYSFKWDNAGKVINNFLPIIKHLLHFCPSNTSAHQSFLNLSNFNPLTLIEKEAKYHTGNNYKILGESK